MKRVHTIIVFALLLMAGLSACKHDNDDNITPPAAADKLVEYDNGESYIRFQIGSDKLVQKAFVKLDENAASPDEYAINYTPDKKIASIVNGAQKIEAVYENGKLKRADMFQGTNKIGQTDYEFNRDHIKKMTISFGLTVLRPMLRHEFDWVNGNLWHITTYEDPSMAGQLVKTETASLEYDEKPNPLREYNDLLYLFWTTASKNNIVLEHHYDVQNSVIGRYQYTYTYHSNGKPQKGNLTTGLLGQQQTTRPVKFTYQ